jgi:hypothetical protein
MPRDKSAMVLDRERKSLSAAHLVDFVLGETRLTAHGAHAYSIHPYTFAM